MARRTGMADRARRTKCRSLEETIMRKMRWVVIFLAFLAIAINYIDRANLAVAAPQIEKALGIGPAEMGFILSGFFWSYALMQMPFGWFVDRVGARIALPLAVGWWSVFTAL